MSLFFEFKFAMRLLLKKPFFAATTIIIMAVGLGLSVYTHTLLYTLLYKPLNIKEGGRLVAITGKFDSNSLRELNVEAFMAKHIREQSSSFSMISAYFASDGTALISGRDSNGVARKLNSSFVEWSVFQIAGVEPLMGRTFTAQDHLQGAEPVIVLSYSVWEHFFSGDPNIIDRIIRVDAEPTRVIGVMPEGFAFPNYAQSWQPMSMFNLNPPALEQGGVIDMMARLKPGVSIEQANAEIERFVNDFHTKYPDHADHISASVKPYQLSGMQTHMPLLAIMSIVVVLILLLSCINVGNLLLSRINERIKEVAVRVALGVPRYRLVMRMLSESVIICVLGGIIALALAGWGLELTNIILDEAYSVEKNKPFWWRLGIDNSALVALLLIVILTIILTSLVPVWRALTGDFNAVLRDGTRGALSKKAARTIHILVISEILLSCIVLIIASMTLTMTYQGSSADYGIDTRNLLTAQVELPAVNYLYRGDDQLKRDEMRNKRDQFYQRFKHELEAEPNILSMASVANPPGTGGGSYPIDVEGDEYTSLESHPKANSDLVVAGSLQSLGLKLIDGRYFNSTDTQDSNISVVISEALAKRIGRNERVVGKRIRWNSESEARVDGWKTIVGVVGNVIHGSAIHSNGMTQTVYQPASQFGGVRVRFKIIIKYAGLEQQAEQTIARVLKRIDPDVPIYNVRTYQRLLEEPLFLISNVSQLFLFCGLIAILLAGAGIYAVVANSIAQRTQEIGVRRALGATDKMVLNMFLSKSAWQLIWGVGVGVIAAIFVTMKVLDMWLIQSVAYMVAYVAIPVLIVGIVLFATYIPAKRALKVEPSEALHYE